MAPKAKPTTDTPPGRQRETLPAPSAGTLPGSDQPITKPAPETLAEREAAAKAASPVQE